MAEEQVFDYTITVHLRPCHEPNCQGHAPVSALVPKMTRTAAEEWARKITAQINAIAPNRVERVEMNRRVEDFGFVVFPTAQQGAQDGRESSDGSEQGRTD